MVNSKIEKKLGVSFEIIKLLFEGFIGPILKFEAIREPRQKNFIFF